MEGGLRQNGSPRGNTLIAIDQPDTRTTVPPFGTRGGEIIS